MDSIRARLRARFPRRKSAGSVLSPMANSTRSRGQDTPTDQPEEASQSTCEGGASSHTGSVETARNSNSQQATHRRSTESVPSVTARPASTRNTDGEAITTASSTNHPRRNSTHDSSVEDFCTAQSNHGTSHDSAIHELDESLDSATTSFSFSSSHLLNSSDRQLPLATNTEPSGLSSEPSSSDPVASSQATPSLAVGFCHEDGPPADPVFPDQDTAAVAKILVTPTSSMSASSAQTPADQQASLLRALLQVTQGSDGDGAPGGAPAVTALRVEAQKVWVRRPGGSATLISIRGDALVDDLRDLILRKYANSIGRHFDSPDLHLHITPRDKRPSRPLGPEERLSETLDSVYPGGQTVEEALVILVPQPHPRPSPRPPGPHSGGGNYPADMGLPSESAEGYFPPIVPSSTTLPHPPGVGGDLAAHGVPTIPPGQAQSVPSPGSGRAQAFADRPRLGRSHTPSPAVQGKQVPVPKPNDPHPLLPGSTSHPLGSATDTTPTTQVSTPPARASSPRPLKKKTRKPEKQLPPVPPINVLLVEDNPINLKLLEAFAKGLKVRWQSAMNGKDAVAKWRSGGFHLVLMDIQLPGMNGLEATREIRRLERENSIGVFSSPTHNAPGEESEMKEEDRLANIEMFKSPVIIVALTASSLQSDRHEALAAGCNDFLTKPVSFPWLETKVREWGCMQALIDFEGWRTWKNYSNEADEREAAKRTTGSGTKTKAKKNRSAQVAAVS